MKTILTLLLLCSLQFAGQICPNLQGDTVMVCQRLSQSWVACDDSESMDVVLSMATYPNAIDSIRVRVRTGLPNLTTIGEAYVQVGAYSDDANMPELTIHFDLLMPLVVGQTYHFVIELGPPTQSVSQWTEVPSWGGNAVLREMHFAMLNEAGGYENGQSHLIHFNELGLVVSTLSDVDLDLSMGISYGNCASDCDANGVVDIGDLICLMSEYGSIGGMMDLDGNGYVGASDVVALIGAWGQICN